MQRRRLLIGSIGLIVIIGLIIGGYFTFRRTLIADIRESAMNIDISDAVAHGATLFETRGCSGCHTFSAAGSIGDVGPSLDGIASRQDAEYIRASIINPNAVIAEGCPEEACEANVMPNFGVILNEAQVDALVAYLQAQS